jgi:hypothetical protein
VEFTEQTNKGGWALTSKKLINSILPYRIDVIRLEYSICQATDLQKGGRITYADFFDIVVPFEKNYRMRVENRNPHCLYPWKKEDLFRPNTINELKELFNLIINLEIEVNNMRKLFGTLRLNLRNIFGQVDKNNAGHFLSDELIEYLDNNRLLVNRRDPDLLFIRLDKNRNGKIEFSEVEDELQTLY